MPKTNQEKNNDLLKNKQERLDSIAAAHGDRAAKVADCCAAVMTLQRAHISLVADVMWADKRPIHQINSVTSMLQSKTTDIAVQMVHLMTDSMPERDRLEFHKVMAEFIQFMDKELEV